MATENPAAGGMELDPKYDDYDYPIIAPVAASGHPGHLTPQQQAQVHQLRMLLESKGYKDRLDTLTLVWSLRVPLCQKQSLICGLSCDSYERESLMSTCPRRCEKF